MAHVERDDAQEEQRERERTAAEYYSPKCSPPPWDNLPHLSDGKHDGHLIVDANGYGVVQLWHTKYHGAMPEHLAEQDANAALIAAAPILLAMLKLFLAAARCNYAPRVMLEQFGAEAEAAVAKAETLA